MAELDLAGPAMAPPKGVVANFDNPPNGNAMTIGLFALMIAISTVFILFRAYNRVFIARKIVIEDVLILCAYGNYWGAAYSNFALIIEPGFYVHQWDMILGDTIKPYYKWIFVFGVFYSVVLACLKIAIVVEWCRIFVTAGSRTRSYIWWCSLAIIIVQGGFGIAAIFLLSFQCVPHEAIWDFTIPATCLDLNTLQLTSSSIHLITDVAIFVLPQHTIWTLNMSVQKKIGVAVVFGLGALAIICAVFRMIATMEFGKSDDKMYTIGDVILWATGEMTCGFFIVCATSLPAILKKSALGRKVRGLLRIKSTKNSADVGPTPNTIGGSSNRNKSNIAGASQGNRSRKDAYEEIHEDEVALKDFDRKGGGRFAGRDGNAIGVTRTTEVTVSQNNDSHSDLERGPIITPWELNKRGN